MTDWKNNQDVIDKLNRFEILLTRIDERQSIQVEKIDKIDKQVNGNGRPGIIDRLEHIERLEVKIMAIAATISTAATFAANFIVNFYRH